jgi:hypothetical protein
MSTNLAMQLQVLGRKQLAVGEGLALLRDIRRELLAHSRSAEAWGSTAVLSNLVLIPLNVIVNSFELGAVNSLYQRVVREVYDRFSASGTRTDGHLATALSILKTSIQQALTAKGLTQHVPGANILVGLAEDSLATWQALDQVQSGRSEMLSRLRHLDHQILRAEQQLVQLGIQRAQVLDRLRVLNRTA